MAFDRTAWAAGMIVKDAPREWLVKLLPLDGTSRDRPAYSRDDLPPTPLSFYAFGMVEGAAGAHVAGLDSQEWLTPLGQMVVDRLKLV